MPFNPNAAELQRKFDRILVAKVTETNRAERFGSPEIVTFFSEELVNPGLSTPEGQLKLTDDELQFFKKNINNYLQRARNSGLIVSFGKKQGYGLAPGAQPEPTSAPTLNAPPNAGATVECRGQGRENRESFLHLPFSLGLMRNFLESEAVVFSMPRAISRGGFYSNPDAIMIRKNELARHRKELVGTGADDLKHLFEQFERVRFAPLIVSSFEYKFFKPDANLRRELTNALTEAQMNSSWANEAWLIYYIEAASPQARPDADVMKLTESMGVGLMQAIERDGEMEFIEWVSPRLREHLDLHGGHVELMQSLNESLLEYKSIQSDGGFQDDKKGAVFQCLRTMHNLFKQDGFIQWPSLGVKQILQVYPKLCAATIELFNGLGGTSDVSWFPSGLVQLLQASKPANKHAELRVHDIKGCLEMLDNNPPREPLEGPA